MSNTRHLSRVSVLNTGKPIVPVRPAKATTCVECVMLENPNASLIADYRSTGWVVVFEAFTPLVTPNGLKAQHFIRMERVAGGYHQ